MSRSRRFLAAAAALITLAACSPDVTTSTAVTVAPARAGAKVLAFTYGASPWNLPIAGFGTHPQSAQYSQRLYRYAHAGGADDPAQRGRFATYFRDYSQPIYDARQATGTIQVFIAGFGFQGSIARGGTVPWNDSWQPPTGNDRAMFIVDPSTGREWDLWLVQTVNKSACVTWENLQLGFNPDARNLCVGQADLVQDAGGRPIDYRSYVGGYPTGGAHIQGMAMVATADEAATGVIPHALNAVVHNTMFGPACSASQRNTAAAGTTCGFFEHPASRLEWAEHPQPCGADTLRDDAVGRATTVPEGMRFGVRLTDAEITRWLDGRGYTGALRNTARIFAVAARDYGFVVTNTSCYGAGFVTDGLFNPSAAAKWRAMGIPDDGLDSLLYGLFTGDNLWAAAPSAALRVGTVTPAR